MMGGHSHGGHGHNANADAHETNPAKKGEKSCH